jgi:2-C-methyl-D-erythritol 2,4-cyclodiphosphate synthase
MRVGIGYDIHRTAPGDHVVLGGVEIPAPFRLEGHSDADVVVHALMDALLGAASMEDIGQHFPPSDARFRGISSLELLRRVRSMLADRRWEVVNVDAVMIGEEPRVGPYVRAMRERIAEALGVDVGAVAVKATTNERVGPEGRREAVSAQAVALLNSAP